MKHKVGDRFRLIGEQGIIGLEKYDANILFVLLGECPVEVHNLNDRPDYSCSQDGLYPLKAIKYRTTETGRPAKIECIIHVTEEDLDKLTPLQEAGQLINDVGEMRQNV